MRLLPAQYIRAYVKRNKTDAADAAALLEAARAKGPTFPATNPPTFYQQLDREALYDIYRGNPPRADARKSEGGFYPNLDNQYIRTFINRKFGPVYVLHGTLPKTPKTMNGDAVMNTKDADMRYWSICSQCAM